MTIRLPLISMLRRNTYSSQNITTVQTRRTNYNIKNSSCQSIYSAQEQSNFIVKSVSQTGVYATVPLEKTVTPLDNLTTTDYEWDTPGRSYSGSSAATTDSHIKPLYTGPTQNLKCVQQNNYEQCSTLHRKHKFTTTKNFTDFKSLPKIPMLDYKRDTNKGFFNLEPNKAKVQGKVQLLHTDGSISDKAIRKSDLYITVSCNYVAPFHSTCEVLDDIKNVDVVILIISMKAKNFYQRQRKVRSLRRKKEKATFAMSLRLSKKELLVREKEQ